MTPVAGGLLAGIAVGAGLALALRGLRPAPPDLAATLGRLGGGERAAARVAATGRREQFERSLGGWLADRLVRPAGGLRIPRTDLRVAGKTVEGHLAQKALLAVSGAALPPILLAMTRLFGWQLPLTFPVVAGIALAVAFWFVPEVAVRADANRLRRDFRAALVAYLELVALERAADAGPAEALSRSATVCGGWPFRRITGALQKARLAGTPPWLVLADLGNDLDVPELADLADIVALAGNDGAAIYDTLIQKAKSMRGAALATSKAEANSASEQMTVPTTLLVFGFLLIAIYPAFARLH